MKNPLLRLLLMVLPCLAICLGTNACGDDDEPSLDVDYTITITETTPGGDTVTETAQIADVFKAVFKTPTLTFTLHGTQAQCDAEVKRLCQDAVALLADIDWAGKYTIQISSPRGVVFTHTFE